MSIDLQNCTKFLCLTTTNRYRLPSLVEMHLAPEILDVRFADRVHTLGYTACCIGSIASTREASAHRLSWQELHKALDYLRAKGIAVVVEFESKDILQNFDPAFYDMFLVKQGVILEKKELTPFDHAKKEIGFLEQTVQKPLIYFSEAADFSFGERQAQWLLSLSFETAKTTRIAFPALFGSYLHPLTQHLSYKNYSLLPIVHSPIRYLPGLYLKIFEHFSNIGASIGTLQSLAALEELMFSMLGHQKDSRESWLCLNRPEWVELARQGLFQRLEALELLALEQKRSKQHSKRLSMLIEECLLFLSEFPKALNDEFYSFIKTKYKDPFLFT